MIVIHEVRWVPIGIMTGPWEARRTLRLVVTRALGCGTQKRPSKRSFHSCRSISGTWLHQAGTCWLGWLLFVFRCFGATVNVGGQLHPNALEEVRCTAPDQWRDFCLRSEKSTQLALRTMLIMDVYPVYLPKVRSDDV